MRSEQKVQEQQYDFPYHYLPTIGKSGFSQTLTWSWGHRYLAGLHLVIEEVQRLKPNSLLDVGCGDGRFLHEIRKIMPHAQLSGIDYSEKAIKFACAFNPGLNFQAADINDYCIDECPEIITLIEVLEHIPKPEVDSFLARLAELCDNKTVLIMTVPHENKPLSSKHFQHFSGESVVAALQPHFEIVRLKFFDRLSLADRIIERIMGRETSFALLNSKRVGGLIHKYLRSRMMLGCEEKMAGRIYLECKRKSR